VNSKKQTQNDTCIRMIGKHNINKEEWRPEKGNISLDNTKQLREENILRTEKEERPSLCVHTTKGSGGWGESEFTGQPIFTSEKSR